MSEFRKKLTTTRRNFLYTLGVGTFVTGLKMILPLPAWGESLSEGVGERESRNFYDLTIGYSPLKINGRVGQAAAINGTVQDHFYAGKKVSR